MQMLPQQTTPSSPPLSVAGPALSHCVVAGMWPRVQPCTRSRQQLPPCIRADSAGRHAGHHATMTSAALTATEAMSWLQQPCSRRWSDLSCRHQHDISWQRRSGERLSGKVTFWETWQYDTVWQNVQKLMDRQLTLRHVVKTKNY